MNNLARERVRRSATKLVRVAAASALVVFGTGVFAVGSAQADDPVPAATDLAPSIHGAVETQAITAGEGALSLLVDPSTAYAYSTLDRDEGLNFSMTARGANLNLGADIYATLWAPPDCVAKNAPCYLSGSYAPGAPNTGLHEAKGFPFYAEALYPPPPSGPSQERVYKCVLTKDAPGGVPTGGAAGDVCKQSGSIPLTAWAETVGAEYRSTGQSRAEGLSVPGLVSVAASESFSDVRALPGKRARSTGYSNVSGINLLGGMITIDHVRSEGTVVSSVDKVETDTASCQIVGLNVLGTPYGNDAKDLASPQLQAALDQIASQTGYQVVIIPPTGPKTGLIDGGKHVAGCDGLEITFTDTHQQVVPLGAVSSELPPLCADAFIPQAPPVCVPALGLRQELSFGRLNVQQAVNAVNLLDLQQDVSVPSVDAGLPTGGSPATLASAAGAGAAAAAVPPGLVADPGGSTVAPSAGASGAARRAVRLPGSVRPFQAAAAHSPFNPKLIGGLTGAAVGALVLGVLFLVGVVNALASGRPLRLPGL
jgi:hypothetical protein